MNRGVRKHKRFDIRCPVTVHLSHGLNHEAEVPGVLYDIGLGGAKLGLEQPLPPGTEITLFVHFQDPDKLVSSTVRFEGTVKRLNEEPRFEIGVGFRGTGRFIQNELSEVHANVANCQEAPEEEQ
jgi:c-di-GMP-binding flagellar brake protein YcgR